MKLDIQVLAILGSSAFLLMVLDGLRRRALQAQYAVLWVTLSAAVLGLSIWRSGLEVLAAFLGVYYAPAALFLVLFLVLFLLCYQLTREASRANHGLRAVTQECALLRLELEALAARLPEPPGSPR